MERLRCMNAALRVEAGTLLFERKHLSFNRILPIAL